MDFLHPCENDALLVDDLLDFSCGDIGEGDDYLVTCVRGKEKDSNSASISSVEETLLRRPSQEASEPGDCLYSLPDELADELEWLSSFVEESYKGADNSLPVSSEQWFSKSTGGRKEGCLMGDGKRPTNTSWLRMTTFSQILDVGSSPLIETPNNTCRPLHQSRSERSRSKRSSRSGGRVWSLQRVMPVSHNKPTHEDDEEEEASSLDYEPFFEQRKKAKKANSSNAVQEGHRCSHCQVQKTPQWRAGPLGPKTLCNACGVRYKSGRLLPEYRPAASPTFISELHSNSHKKVLEMRTFKSCVAQELDQEEFSSCSEESISSLQL